jgi:hypothetical protein
MPQFTLHRNYIMNTTKGHSIRFVKDKPVNVPPICVEDAVAIGAQPVNPEEGDVLGEEEKVQPSLSPDEREAKVFEAFGVMKTRNERGDFTASGLPNNKRLPALLGFELTNRERDTYWQKYRELEQAAIDQAELDHRAEADGVT